jgi:hypothetical protein
MSSLVVRSVKYQNVKPVGNGTIGELFDGKYKDHKVSGN